jgi:hypothetical protein
MSILIALSRQMEWSWFLNKNLKKILKKWNLIQVRNNRFSKAFQNRSVKIQKFWMKFFRITREYIRLTLIIICLKMENRFMKLNGFSMSWIKKTVSEKSTFQWWSTLILKNLKLALKSMQYNKFFGMYPMHLEKNKKL